MAEEKTLMPPVAGQIQESPAQNPLRVYLVEDSAMIRDRVIEQITENTASELIGCAETEDDALDGIRELQPDAIVLDIELRQGNGFNVLRRLQHMTLERRPVIIVFSNHAESDFRRRAVADGARYFIDKASEFSQLTEVLESLRPQSALSH
jgi:two-component system OmpR family response regulator